MPHAVHELTDIIRREIEGTGPVSFARFMELALYHPIHGYYERSIKQIGCQGDFYTSVSVGPVFGELLAFWFTEWLKPLGMSPLGTKPPKLVDRQPEHAGGAASGSRPQTGASRHLVEAGAHDGRLAADILSWLKRQRPDLLPNLEYWILEPSERRRELQERALQPFQGQVRWFGGWEDLPASGVHGVIFSNELLDAFPVFRLGWDAKRKGWFEWRVDWAGDRFTWSRGPGRSPEVERELETAFWLTLPAELLALLPDGFTVEICPAADRWWSEAAGALREGKLLTFDYGLEAAEFFAPHRKEGTLRSYRGHRPGADPLTSVGEQDLTAHVNFTALQQTGEKAGLQTEGFRPQAEFLTRIIERIFQDPSRFGEWTQAETRQFQTLVHPEHLGRSFRVLVQARSPEPDNKR